MVEAIIVELDIIQGRDLGLQWLFANQSGAFGSNISTSSTQQAANGSLGSALLPADGTSNDIGIRDVASALAGIPGTTLGWGVVDDSLTMTTILSALESQGNTNILSTPSLLTLDNEEALITVGQQVPFVTGSYTNTGASNGVANPFQTIQRVSASLCRSRLRSMRATRLLWISQEVSSISQQVLSASDVITNERKIETKVLAKDGDIIVLEVWSRMKFKTPSRSARIIEHSRPRTFVPKRCGVDLQVKPIGIYTVNDYPRR